MLRVVQWATGNIGTHALRSVIGHPGLELVGLHVYSADKVGRDAGELCGLDPVGVVATSSLDDIVALGADCVLYMPRRTDADELCALLASGSNVVTTRGDFHHVPSIEPGLRSRIEEACLVGGTSIHSTGSSPGFITEALPLVLASIQRRLDGVVIDEFADMSKRPSPGLMFEVMKFGHDPSLFDPRRFTHGRESFGPSLRLIADAMRVPLDDVVAQGEVAVTPRTIEIAAGTIEAGKVAGQRMVVHGLRDGRPFLTFRANWYCTTDLEPAWDLRETGWRVVVDGDAPLDIDIRFPIPLERMAATTPGYTASRPVNAVPYVCAAPPGIVTSIELPQIIPTF